MSQTEFSMVLARLLEPVTRSFTPEVARELVGLRLTPEVQDRIDLLAEKCNEGELSGEERSEYESYVRAIDLISILQARARELLAEDGRA
jgi:hypothetical protein